MESSVLEDVSLPEGTVQRQSSSDAEEPRPTTSQANMINTLGEVKMCCRSTKSVAFSGTSSAVRRRLEARLAEVRLEQVRRDEELKLQTLALVEEQEIGISKDCPYNRSQGYRGQHNCGCSF